MLTPIIIRSSSDSKYEIISGHRRVEVCKKLGIDAVPAIVKELTNEEAIIAMVDANLQRENLLPSEKAFAYKMKLEAIKHQGKSTSRQLVGKPESADQISNTDSGRQVQRYIRLTYLVPELLKMVDPQAPPIGTKGTVIGVDDIGSIMVSWDTGSGLNVAYGVDVCRKVADGNE